MEAAGLIFLVYRSRTIEVDSHVKPLFYSGYELAAVYQILRSSGQSQVAALYYRKFNCCCICQMVQHCCLWAQYLATFPLPFYTFPQCVANVNSFFASFQFMTDHISQQFLEGNPQKTAHQISVQYHQVTTYGDTCVCLTHRILGDRSILYHSHVTDRVMGAPGKVTVTQDSKREWLL